MATGGTERSVVVLVPGMFLVLQQSDEGNDAYAIYCKV